MSAPTSNIPNGLDVVIDFVNTLDREEDTDALASPSDLEAWLRAHELLSGRAGAERGDLAAAIELREALRVLALANNGGEHAPDAWATLERTARAGALSVHFDDDGEVDVRADAGGVAGALALILARVAAAAADLSWARVKACRSDSCEWAFYDLSRNRSGVWCDMAVCGNRTKVRAYRDRSR